ncbi:putative transcriptional regulator [Pseudonocardia sediminis]|uniref:Putative transcriptional regulator n=1 Tax=Pseudonocardia sediminis TaxID=1397368 RepID=A0A4Q7UV47_PSEST|nr:BlaI/MecI/CopY family transcriptional regulator [Pseudonocardia sediminis]RZT85656.1 putative transcriptional regulator [Pseudonocardia sediminis]
MRQLGALEAEVMGQLWSADRSHTVREVLDGLRISRDLAYTTVLSTMGNLLDKGYLTRVSEGRAHRYEPTLSRAEYAARLMREAMTHGGDEDLVLLRFVGELPEDQQTRLKDVLDTPVREPEPNKGHGPPDSGLSAE